MTTTPNDPNPTPDRLPVRADFGAADGPATPLSQAPTAALAFALGAAVTRPQSANHYAPFCALIEELSAREVPLMERVSGHEARIGEWNRNTELGRLMATLPPRIARAIHVLYQAQRGQRWAATGRRNG